MGEITILYKRCLNGKLRIAKKKALRGSKASVEKVAITHSG